MRQGGDRLGDGAVARAPDGIEQQRHDDGQREGEHDAVQRQRERVFHRRAKVIAVDEFQDIIHADPRTAPHALARGILAEGDLQAADRKIGEDDEINERLTILDSAEKIKETLSYVLNLLSEDKGIVSRLQDSIKFLGNLSNLESISNLQERLTNSKYELQDIIDELQNIFSSSAFDEIEYERLDTRKDLLKSIKKKYGATLELVLEYCEKSKNI